MRNKKVSENPSKVSTSPVPPSAPVAGQTSMKFPQAIEMLIGGAKIRREEWLDKEEYGLLKESFLMIHRGDKFHTWIVSEGDLMAQDWVIIK